MKKNYMAISRLLLTCLFLINALALKAGDHGDTTVVNTFNFNSPARSGMFQFPNDSTKTYEKIIMLYKMRCKGGQISTSTQRDLGCGEWDYNCYTYIVDSSQTDSVKATSPNFAISNWANTSYPYVTNPMYNYIQTTQQDVVYTSTISETTALSGNGSLTLSNPLGAASPLGRVQYLWTAAELTSAGLTAGDITGLGLDLTTFGNNLNNLRIRIKTTTQSVLSYQSAELSGFTEVYYLNSSFGAAGNRRFNFHTPFNWNGTSNLLVEFSYTNASATSNNEVAGTNSGYTSGLYTTGADTYIEANGGAGTIDVPGSVGSMISNKITIAFWCYGDPARLPANTSIFEALDANGVRQLNLHLPWSDGSVYWDCGNDGTGYDRINKAATTAQTEGQWNFWAVTKDATTGSMKIYLNGVLWHSGTAKTKPISIASMKISRAISGNYLYYGNIDEFSIWNTELSLGAVQEIMYRNVTPSFPDYANLVAYYQFNDGAGAAISDASPNGYAATQFNLTWRNRRGTELFRNFVETAERPNTTFVKGTYITQVTPITILDSTAIAANSVIEYTVVDNNLTAVDTNLYWAANGYVYTYDEFGAKLDSTLVNANDTLQVVTLNYYNKFPARIELINFITPYGIGLDMNGLIGKTWMFDVTDYAPILRGNKYMVMDGGKNQEDNDITFVYYEGTPPRDVHSLQQIWPNGSRAEISYGQILANEFFEARDIQLSSNSSMWKIRSQISGHGQEGEFISRVHTLRLNNQTNYSRAVWAECAANPIYPQGGTWVYDRAGWCPGASVDLKEYDITGQVTPGQLINIDYSLPNASNIGDSRYRVNNQLVSYGAPNFTLDASLSYIKYPTNRVEYERLNPICNQPVVAIKNTGSTPLTSVDITYGRMGGTMSTYTWTGSLNFLQEAEVVLPQPAWLSSNTNEFIAIVSNPNNATDQYGLNDTLINTFNYPTVLPQNFYFELRTNNNGTHTSYTLKDSQGNIVVNRTGLSANTTYRDTVNLTQDCYTLLLTDFGDDGLSWWANTAQGTGYFRIRSATSPVILKVFNPDFGDNIYQQFTVNYTVPVNEINGFTSPLEVYPNPAKDLIQVAFSAPQLAQVRVELRNVLGQTLLTQEVTASETKQTIQLDVNQFEAGVYYVVVQSGTEQSMQKVIIQR